MAAGKCGCAGTTCSCVIKGDGVTGAGSVNNPYIIRSGVTLHANSTATINHSLLGDGSPSNPWVLTSNATLNLGDLLDVDTSVTTLGYVPARQADGSFAMVPPSTAPVGAISAGNSIEGDGSSGDPLDVRLGSNSGLEITAGGLVLDPYTVATEADLDSTYGAVPVGTLVSDTDGSGVWVKTASGWAVVAEDTGNITTVSGNATAASGWVIDSMTVRRRNGIVQLFLLVHTTIDRVTGVENGNVANIDVANIVQAKFRPVTYAAMGAGSVWGPIVGAGIGSSGNVVIGALPHGATPAMDAGEQVSLMATYIGA